MIRTIVALSVVVFATSAFARTEVTDRQSCLSYFADAVRSSENYQYAPTYHAKILENASETAKQYADAIVTAHEQIAQIYQQIAENADLMCRQYD